MDSVGEGEGGKIWENGIDLPGCSSQSVFTEHVPLRVSTSRRQKAGAAREAP